MARYTPTHEPPDFPDEELLPEEPAPSGRQLLRMFIPVAFAIVVFITALLLVVKFVVIPALERGDPAAQSRAVATLGALQTQQALTRTQQALTPQPTAQPTSTPRAVATVQPASQPTIVSTPAAAPPASQVNQAPTSVAAAIAGTPPAPTLQALAAPVSVTTGTSFTQPAAQAVPEARPTVDPVAQSEVLQAYALYWQQRTLAFRDLDASLLDSVAAGPELDGLTGKIDRLRSEGRAIRTHVIHHVVALPTAPGEAVVADEYEDLSTYVDFSTQDPIDPANADPQSGPVVKVREVLQRIDGVWKVTGGQLYE